MNDELELYDTTIFNGVVEALDTGKIIYLYNETMVYYQVICSFGLAIIDNSHCISLGTVDGGLLNIYPSEGYNVSDLYTPTNIAFSEVAGLAM